MSYVPLDLNEIKAGEPLKEEILQKIKDNQDSFNNTLQGLEAGGTVVIANLLIQGVSEPSTGVLESRMPIFRARFETRIIWWQLAFPNIHPDDTENLTGTLNINIEKSTDIGDTWNEIWSSDLSTSDDGQGDSITASLTPSSTDSNVLQPGDMVRIKYNNRRNKEPNHHHLIIGELI